MEINLELMGVWLCQSTMLQIKPLHGRQHLQHQVPHLARNYKI